MVRGIEGLQFSRWHVVGDRVHQSAPYLGMRSLLHHMRRAVQVNQRNKNLRLSKGHENNILQTAALTIRSEKMS